ncbi:MAG TPA: beta-N-acetylhexosaminidase [Cyclobacteriaceae bacterium]|nr:beta-N-acetylhexosaminidase [Cyclobacteriaceae bacterium]
MEGIATEKPSIFPVPQQSEVTNESFILDETVSIVIPPNVSKADFSLANFLVGELTDKYGLVIKIETLSDIPVGRKVMVMGTLNNSIVKKYCKKNELELTEKNPGKEGYILQVSNNLVVIGGCDDAGAFFGLQSLRQLIDAGEGKKIQGIKVRDWPSFPFRAIKVYVPGPENIAFFKRFLRDFMALYKYNKVMIEFNSMRLDKHPEVNAGWVEFAKYMQYTRLNETQGIHGETKNSTHYDAGDGFIIEKKDVKDLVDFAQENFIEVIPEIPSLTHAYSLLTRHPELAEYPGDKWPDTYCPSNPASYKLMFDVYDEYIDVTHPKMIHIGHDEWWGAPLDVCPRCKGKDYSGLYAGDVKKIHDHLAAKGIKTAMWGDFLLESVRGVGPVERISSTGRKYKTPGGLRPEVVQKTIPKDVLIFNWFYSDEKKELELQKFGFKQVYGNFEPNISHWNERIKKFDLMGGAPSSWASTNEFNFGKDLLSDFLGCANLLWSSHTIRQEDLAPIVWQLVPSIRKSFKAERVPSEDGDMVVPIDISSHFNLSKDSKVFGVDLASLKEGQVHNRFKLFNLSDTSANCAIAVGSIGSDKNALPNEVSGIQVNEDVSSLIFLQASALPAGNQKAYFNIPDNFDAADVLGWYEIVYEDEYREIVPVQYGVNILEWNPGGEKSLNKNEGETGSAQKTYSYEADAINCSSNEKEKPITFFAFEWVNKRFGKKIKEVNLLGTENYQALQQEYSKPVTQPAPSNAILLIGLSKVIKREPLHPQ